MFLAEIKFAIDKDGGKVKTSSTSSGFEYKPGCGFQLDFDNLIPLSSNPVNLIIYGVL